jgi:flagellar hook-basal body complex protein FliE
MILPPVSPIAGPGSLGPAPAVAGPGFGEKIMGALEGVSGAEAEADRLVRDVATGGPTSVHELMVATTKAALSVEMLVQVRNKAIEAYQEIMRMQV